MSDRAPTESATGDAPVRIHAEKDFAPYQRALQGWMEKALPDRPGLRIHDLRTPSGSGHSNETVFFEATWSGRSGEEPAPASAGAMHGPET